MAIEVTPAVVIPDDELEWKFIRASGPGGQNVNKVSSKAVLRWPVRTSPSLPPHVRDRLIALNRRRVTTEGELVITSQRYRDQERNKEDCLLKLAEMVRAALVEPTVRKATKPSKGAKRRRVADKRRTSAKKQSRRVSGGDD